MLGNWLKGVIEAQGSDLTGTRVLLAEAAVSPLSGSIALRGLSVANPEGFQTERVLSVGLVTAKVDLWSMGAQVLRIGEVEVAGVDVILETGAHGTNLARLKRSMAKAREGSALRHGPEPRLLIDRLIVRGGRLDLHAAGRMRSLPLPALEVPGLNASGATFAEIGEAFFLALAEEAVKSSARLLKRLGGSG